MCCANVQCARVRWADSYQLISRGRNTLHFLWSSISSDKQGKLANFPTQGTSYMHQLLFEFGFGASASSPPVPLRSWEASDYQRKCHFFLTLLRSKVWVAVALFFLNLIWVVQNGPDSWTMCLVPDCSELAQHHSRYRLTTGALINGPFIVAFIGPLFPRQLRYPPDTSGAAWGGGSG